MAYLAKAKDAIIALGDRAGSSLPALKKYLNLAPDKNRFLNAALKSGVASGALVQNKGKYKVSQAAKAAAKKAAKPKKKAAPKKKKAAPKKKKAAPKKKKATKKKPAKKKAAKKKAPKKKKATKKKK